MKLWYILIIVLIVSSCSNRKESLSNNADKVNKCGLEYANGFILQKNKSYSLVTIKNPWQGAEGVEYKYALVDKDEANPNIDKSYQIIKTPVKRVICLSTTHVAFIDVLNEDETIVGVSGAKYINSPGVRKRIKSREIVDVGYDNSLNYELIASMHPDLVITYGVGGKVASYNQKLNELGIPTIIVAEYLENGPLGKLEWIKLIAAFYNKEKQAVEYFNRVKKQYNNLLTLTKKISYKPKVLLGLPWKDTWYVPGGKSFMAKMIKDAGGDYIWKTNESRESLPFGIESVFINASDADVWINTGTVNSKNDILKIDERFKDFTPFIKARIYNNNRRINKNGGNDYWERGLVEPQVLLKDMIKIIHPEILPDYQLVYYKIIE